jgi:hypothetical protein
MNPHVQPPADQVNSPTVKEEDVLIQLQAATDGEIEKSREHGRQHMSKRQAFAGMQHALSTKGDEGKEIDLDTDVLYDENNEIVGF